MIEVVNIRGNTIAVRDDLAARVTICTRCKGFKLVTRTFYQQWSPFFWLYGYVPCPQCDGRGMFYEAER